MAYLNDDDYVELTVPVEIVEDLEREVLAPLRALGADAEIPAQGSGTPIENMNAIISLVGASVSLAATIASFVRDWRKRQPPSKTIEVVIKRHGKIVADGIDIPDEEITIKITEE